MSICVSAYLSIWGPIITTRWFLKHFEILSCQANIYRLPRAPLSETHCKPWCVPELFHARNQGYLRHWIAILKPDIMFSKAMLWKRPVFGTMQTAENRSFILLAWHAVQNQIFWLRIRTRTTTTTKRGLDCRHVCGRAYYIEKISIGF